MPKVSVIIPAYNAMRYLPETLSNVFKQTFSDFEVVIVNDGSTDHIESWFTTLENPKVSLVSQENQGLAGARNTGIQQSSGEYLALLDADDLWHPTKLDKQVCCLDEDASAGLVYTWTALVNEVGVPTGRFFKADDEGKIWRKLIEFNVVGCGSVPLIRRSCFNQVGLFDRNLGSFVEDWDMWLRLAPHYNFRVIKEALVYYRQLPSSASRNCEAMAKSYQMVIDKTFQEAPQDLHFLKAKSQGVMTLNLAWKPLQSKVHQPQVAAVLLKQAIAYYPRLIFAQEFWKLFLLISLNQILSPASYTRFLSTAYRIRRTLLRRSHVVD